MLTPNEAIASIETRQDALDTITSLYGVLETDLGKRFLFNLFESRSHEILDWLPDDALIELAKMHMHEEWRGYPWK